MKQTPYTIFRRMCRRNLATILAVSCIATPFLTWLITESHRRATSVEIALMRIEIERINADNKKLASEFNQSQDFSAALMNQLAEIKGYRTARVDANMEKLIQKLPEQ
jgi:hypothetical protein